MKESHVMLQAADLEYLLPGLARRLFTLDPDHPVNDLPVAQLRVCTILQAGPRTISSISEELDISPSATTQLADRLERAGLVERSPSQADRRQKILGLTRHGNDLMRSRRSGRVRCAALILERMPAPERQKLIDAANAVLNAADDRAEESDDEYGTSSPRVQRRHCTDGLSLRPGRATLAEPNA
ncbi:MAG: MarR family transcriptional regulator [Chloroflexi bacterium]|nr:MarR family transcriptional regulator [Chloroflexota bacterium]